VRGRSAGQLRVAAVRAAPGVGVSGHLRPPIATGSALGNAGRSVDQSHAALSVGEGPLRGVLGRRGPSSRIGPLRHCSVPLPPDRSGIPGPSAARRFASADREQRGAALGAAALPAGTTVGQGHLPRVGDGDLLAADAPGLRAGILCLRAPRAPLNHSGPAYSPGKARWALIRQGGEAGEGRNA
jgi:hypothetical protein